MTKVRKCGYCGKEFEIDSWTSDFVTEHALYQHGGFFNFKDVEKENK